MSWDYPYLNTFIIGGNLHCLDVFIELPFVFTGRVMLLATQDGGDARY